MTTHRITLRSGLVVTIDETKSESDIRNAEPKFFAQSHGKRETFEMYRGCLIVRHTTQFGAGKPLRLTVVYAFGSYEEAGKTHWMTSVMYRPETARGARKLIDQTLKDGKVDTTVPTWNVN